MAMTRANPLNLIVYGWPTIFCSNMQIWAQIHQTRQHDRVQQAAPEIQRRWGLSGLYEFCQLSDEGSMTSAVKLNWSRRDGALPIAK